MLKAKADKPLPDRYWERSYLVLDMVSQVFLNEATWKRFPLKRRRLSLEPRIGQIVEVLGQTQSASGWRIDLLGIFDVNRVLIGLAEATGF